MKSCVIHNCLNLIEKIGILDAGDIELFKKLETILIQALPQESTEWSRKYGRCTKTVTLSTVFKPFSENSFQDKKHYHLLEQPVLHVFWTQCAVSVTLFKF